MKPWEKKIVLGSDLNSEKDYFLGRFVGRTGHEYIGEFMAIRLDGKNVWSCKPGIARKFIGNSALCLWLTEHPEYRAIEVPADAAKRWRARKPVLSWKERNDI